MPSYVAVLMILAVAAAGWLAARSDAPADVPTLVVLAVIATVAELVPVRFRHSGHTQGFTLESAAVVALLLAGFASVTPALMMCLSAAAHGLRSRDAIKTGFNTARSGVESAAAASVFVLVAPPIPLVGDTRSIVAALTAVAVFEITSMLLTTELMARLGQSSRRATLQGVRGLWGVNVAGNVGYGIVLATVLQVQLWIGVLTGLMMLVMYVGYRGYAAALSGERRAKALHEMTHMLIDLPTADEGVGSVLGRLVAAFGGDAGVLVVESDAACIEWRVADGALDVGVIPTAPRSGILARAMARDRGIVESEIADGARREAVAAPIRRQAEPIGAIAIEGRRGVEPWGEADASLLAAVANELAVALDNVDLLNQVEEERARLEAESTKLNDILTAATDGIVSVLVDGSIEAWNPGMARITGVGAEAAIGQTWHAVLRLKDEAGSELAPTGDHVMSRAMAGQHAGEALTLQALRADGVWRWVQCTSSPVRNPDGTTRGVVLIARDVTGERELEELKTDFIATVSHELRTPLTPLKGFLSTLRNPRTALSDDQLGAIHGAMGTQLLRLETLIADLLAVAEIDHGQFDLRPEPLEISDLVADVVEVEAADELSRCSVLVEPEVTAVADSVALVRIVRSLVSNALKHTTAEVEVMVRSVDDHVEVVVRDEGPGIAQWDQQRIFNRFERLGNHLNRTQGPGLGLTIARSLAHRMGGDVELTSDIGRGATFTLTLPRARPRSVPLRVASEA